ncbi:SusC/RagA family TonB-linked outer membrane protein [Arcticibacter tournemirensis]
MKAKNSLRGFFCPWLTYYILNIRSWLLVLFYFFLIILFSLMAVVDTYAQPTQTISGKVTDERGEALAGAIIKLKGTTLATSSGRDGAFRIKVPAVTPTLIISFIGYQPQEATLKPGQTFLSVSLIPNATQLEEVAVVSTGYQTLPKERATGSFTSIDNQLLTRSVSTNILDRLNGVASGLIFTVPGQSVINQGSIEIRGRSTLFGNAEPLIVLDNFPYEGGLDNINPNDIESITVLKDAAAASAWGTRAGNGVIVITTKKGSLQSGPRIDVSSNITISQKPDLYYSPQLSSAQFIEVQQFLYNKGAYTNAINDGYSALAPAVELFDATRKGLISASDSLQAINQLKQYDIRDQLSQYFYQRTLDQQYQLSLSGGSSSQKYFLSGGYDSNQPGQVGNSYRRVTLNASNTWYLLKNKLEVFSAMVYTGSQTKAGKNFLSSYPYDQVADAEGNALPIANTLRLSYAEKAGEEKLLDWLYRPLDELSKGYNTTKTNQTNYRLNLALNYAITSRLKASALYNYEKSNIGRSTLNELESFYTRDLINRFSQIDQTTGEVSHPLPVGDIFYNNLSNLRTHNGRLQLNYHHTWGRHALDALGGTEVRETKVQQDYFQYYGYDRNTGVNQNASVNYTTDYPYLYGSSSGRIPANTGQSGTLNRYLSWYFNGSYTYSDKYILSLSARKDESNLFGVSANKKGVPLWSTGLAWNVSNETFYGLGWLPALKLRASFGFTGNVDNSLSALLTTTSSSQHINQYNTLYALVVNPPNPSLSWEKVKNLNAGIDFNSKGDRLSGSIDLWRKAGTDLIGSSPIAPQTGITVFRGNSANTVTRGADIRLSSINLRGAFRWTSTFLYNYSKDKVTAYKADNGTNYQVASSNYNNPLEGYPYYSVFSFRYGGLTSGGDPQGYLNGELSTDYSAITNSVNRAELVFHGSATPTSFGSLRNTFTFKGLELSCLISYRLGYYFRRNSLNASTSYSDLYRYADYEKRWQQPGDELHTSVPSLVYPGNLLRGSLYTYSDFLVEKGDNIRLQDVRLSYTLAPRHRKAFKSLTLFTYASNLGILWRANKQGLDPDVPTGIPAVRMVSFGFRSQL